MLRFFAQFGTIFDHKYDISTIQSDDQSLRFPDPTCSVVSSWIANPAELGGMTTAMAEQSWLTHSPKPRDTLPPAPSNLEGELLNLEGKLTCET